MIDNCVGIVLSGGKSKRMGSDKSLLQYYDKPQRYHVYDLLAFYCEQVYIACSKEQIKTIDSQYQFIADKNKYMDAGPIGALLSVFEEFPDSNVLLIGCDYPMISKTELDSFINSCKGSKPVSFFNEGENLYEPILTWYPNNCYMSLIENWQSEAYSLQHFLLSQGAIKYFPENKDSIISIDTLDAFIATRDMINGQK